MAQSPRPDKASISRSVEAIGGSLSTLPYNMPVQGQSGEGGTPQRLQVTQFGGIWGQFYWQVGQDMAYHLLEFHDEVRGDSNNRALPANWTVRLPPTGPNKCRMYRDQIFTGDPQFKVTFPGIRNSARRALLEQQWTAYLMNEVQYEEQVSDQSPLDTMKQHTVDYGCGSRYDIIDMTRWPERPKKRRGESREAFNERMSEYEIQRRSISPFIVRTIHPLNFAYDLSTTPPRWAMVREPIFPWDAQARFPAWRPNQTFIPAPGAQPATKVEWWTPDWQATFINGEPALGPEDGADENGVAPNPYGHIPITFAAGGGGEGDVANRPEVLLQGILRKIRPLLLEEALLFNLMGVYERAVSFGPKKVIRGPEGDIDGERGTQIETDLMAGPQVVAKIPTGWAVESIQPSQLPAEIPARRAELREDIDQATAYDVAAGAPQSGPGIKMQLQLGQVQKRTSLDVLHMQQALEMWGKNRLLALRRLAALKGEKVGANLADKGKDPQWTDLDPATIPELMVVTCDLTSDSETEKARKEQSGLALFEKGLVSDEDFWEAYMQDPDPQARVASVMAYQMRQQVTLPAMKQVAQQGVPLVLAQLMQEQGKIVQFSQDGGQTWTLLDGQPGTAGNSGQPAAGDPTAPQPQPGPGGDPTQLQTGPQGAVLPGEPQNQASQQAFNPTGPGQQRFFPQIAA